MKTKSTMPLGRQRVRQAARILRSTKAFSLVELMVTLVVSGLLVTGIVSGYVVQKRSYEDESGMIDMQMNGRLAMNRVAEVIRNAGLGCMDNFPPKNNEEIVGAFAEYKRVFTVEDNNNRPDVLTVVSGRRSRTVVESLGADHVVLEEIENPNGVPFFDLDKNRYIFFSPQGENQFLEVLGVDPSTRVVKLSAPCTTLDNEFCSIREGDNVFRVNAFTIALDQNGSGSVYLDVDQDGVDVDGDGDGVPDLYIYSNTSDLIPDLDAASAGQVNVSTAEAAEGIEALQFRFGWDMDGDGEIYLDDENQDADEFVNDPTGNEDDIRAVRIYLLARSLLPDPNYAKNNPDESKTYTLANYNLTVSGDLLRYHRQLFVETVMVRNLNL